MSSKTEQVICITSCDRYLGNGIARVLLNDRKQHGQKYQVRVLARDISNLNEFKNLGAEVIQIDYNKTETIERALTGSLWVLWIPESDNDRLNLAKIFADACKKVGVGNLLFASILGADDADEKCLREFREMERKAESIVDRHCILRSALFVQCLHYFSKRIIEKNQLTLPIRRESRMAPIHLNDVYCSIHRIICDEHCQLRDMDKNHQKRHYTLTGPESISTNTLIDMMNVVTDARIEFMEIKRQECEEYLRSCEDKQMTGLTKFGDHEENREDLFPTPPCPNDTEIETL
ncbi:14930_t:CDS:2 [Cetraspora pellucida]|uniref:14930_t:CDS:1 n=1 Tax=Cetraspora pellucida TaxID=1433469 RepID=A0ACA9NYH9_9GLOM|nr:14930_t:CDS:2 [Cetraspora pellucida]